MAFRRIKPEGHGFFVRPIDDRLGIDQTGSRVMEVTRRPRPHLSGS